MLFRRPSELAEFFSLARNLTGLFLRSPLPKATVPPAFRIAHKRISERTTLHIGGTLTFHAKFQHLANECDTQRRHRVGKEE
jgi:hypothetical protein